MSKEPISFRIEADKRAALEELAATLERDRSALINDALDAYLDLHHWQVEHIRRALADAESGDAGVPTTKCSIVSGPESMIASNHPTDEHCLAPPG